MVEVNGGWIIALAAAEFGLALVIAVVHLLVFLSSYRRERRLELARKGLERSEDHAWRSE